MFFVQYAIFTKIMSKKLVIITNFLFLFLLYCIFYMIMLHSPCEYSFSTFSITLLYEKEYSMKMTLRWYGSSFDTVTLKQIRQIPGVTGVISTLYDTSPGEVWSRSRIQKSNRQASLLWELKV